MKKRYGFALSLIVIGLMFFVLKDIDFLEVWNLLLKVKLQWFLLAFLIYGFSFVIWNLRFKYSLKSLIAKGNFWYVFAVLFSGVFMNTITPGTNVGGETVRAYFLEQKFKKPKTKFLGAILADKFFNVFSFGFFLIFSTLFVLVFIQIPIILKFILESILIGFILSMFILGFLIWKEKKVNINWFLRKIYLLGRMKKRFKNISAFKEYIEKGIKNFGSIFKKVVINKKRFVFGVLSSFFIWVLVYLVSYCLFLSFNSRVAFLSIIIVVTLSNVLGDVSPIPGGVGLIESSMFLLYSAMGVESSLAIAVALLSRTIYYFYAIFIGGLSLIYLKTKY